MLSAVPRPQIGRCLDGRAREEQNRCGNGKSHFVPPENTHVSAEANAFVPAAFAARFAYCFAQLRPTFFSQVASAPVCIASTWRAGSTTWPPSTDLALAVAGNANTTAVATTAICHLIFSPPREPRPGRP